MTIGALLMIKNEETSIQVTLDSLKGYIDTVIVYDTGSMDNTLSILVNCCQKNKQTLHLKTTDIFDTFSESRNESLHFADTLDIDYLLLLDAGDEFRCTLPSTEFRTMISSIPKEYHYGMLKLKWLENGILTEHDGLRLIRNHKNIRYDLRYPVHEQLILKDSPILPLPMLHLYQNRDLYGESTNRRFARDIYQLENAVKCRRNYFYLAQSYGAIGDIDKYYTYNVAALDTEDDGSVDTMVIYSRILYCALVKNMDKAILLKYFRLAMENNCELLEIYINMLKYCINNRIVDIMDPYLHKIAGFSIQTASQVNYEDFQYTRWHLISKYCLLANRQKDLGKRACQHAISAKHKPEDILELRSYEVDEVVEVDDVMGPPNGIDEPYIEITQLNRAIPQDQDQDRTTIGVLLMVKNEETSIKATLESIKHYFEHVIVFDTGSTDNTIPIIKKTCEKNGQMLYVKVADGFKGFPKSRNEAIEFAETVDMTYLLLMDAGDEFQTRFSKDDLLHNIRTIPKHIRFGVVRQDWKSNNRITSHSDIRFIKNNTNCRYDLDYPVHEKFIMDERVETPLQFYDMFILFQDRELYGKSTIDRYQYDIEMLSKAKASPRNYYFLGQTYMDIQDFEKGYMYNKKTRDLAKATNNDNIDIESVLIRLLYCAIQCDMDHTIIYRHFKDAIGVNEMSNTIIDAYVYFLHYCIKTNRMDDALPLLEPLSKIKYNAHDITNINHMFFKYERWHVISVICIMTRQQLDLGKKACQLAIAAANKPEDKNNMVFFT